MARDPNDEMGAATSKEITATAQRWTGLSGTRRAAVVGQQRSVELAEHLSDVRRFQAGLVTSLPLYALFGLLDASSALWGGSSLVWLWSLRYGFFVPLAPLVLYGTFRKQTPSPGLLRAMDVILFGGASWVIAVMALGVGGISSHYITGILMVLIARSTFSAQHWRRALLPNAVIVAAYPSVMGIAALLLPTIRAQLHDPAACVSGVYHVLFIVGTAALAISGSHYAHGLRRQLVESRSIGRYRLKNRLGAGGMGEVWAAYHVGLNRDVALKILRPQVGGDEEATARFEREVKATSELVHPNTVRVYDFGVTEDGIFYYAMELLEGRTFGELVRAEGPLDPARAVHLVLQAARSLAEAHGRGIVHRDLKPANLFVTTVGGEPDFVKLLDFGIAKVTTDADANLTSTGTLAGTPKYMAPEVVTGAPATPRSDVYGMGAVLFFLLAGRAPFEGETTAAIYLAHVHAPPPRIAAVRGKPVPEPLERLVARCLAKRPAERFGDAAELAIALAALGGGTISLAPAPASTPTVRTPALPRLSGAPVGLRLSGAPAGLRLARSHETSGVVQIVGLDVPDGDDDRPTVRPPRSGAA